MSESPDKVTDIAEAERNIISGKVSAKDEKVNSSEEKKFYFDLLRELDEETKGAANRIAIQNSNRLLTVPTPRGRRETTANTKNQRQKPV